MAPFKRREVLGLRQSERLRVFLISRLQKWRWPVMLSSGGIQVEVGATPVPGLTLDYQLGAGEVVVIDDGGAATDAALRKEASSNFKDYVFCPQRAGDTFLENQVAALLLDPNCVDIGVGLKDFQALIADLQSFVTAPMRYLILVSHASEAGDILMPMRPAKNNADLNAMAIMWESLNEAIAAKALEIPPHDKKPTLLPRPERNGLPVARALLIRGCTSGKHQIYLKKIAEALGGVETVVMPKFFDGCNFIGGTTTKDSKAVVEYFLHNFYVTSPTTLTRAAVITALQAKKYTDWLGTAVADSEWESLVPKDVNTSTTAVKEVKVTIDGRTEGATMRTRFERAQGSTLTLLMPSPAKPDAAAIKKYVVDSWKRTEMFKDQEWPMWKRYDLASLDDFIALWTFEEDPGYKEKLPADTYAVHAMLWSYTVRTPLVENGTLLANYHPLKEKGTPTNLIDYNDDRVFGRSSVIPKGFDPKL